eukprot:sb/3474487/
MQWIALANYKDIAQEWHRNRTDLAAKDISPMNLVMLTSLGYLGLTLFTKVIIIVETCLITSTKCWPLPHLSALKGIRQGIIRGDDDGYFLGSSQFLLLPSLSTIIFANHPVSLIFFPLTNFPLGMGWANLVDRAVL